MLFRPALGFIDLFCVCVYALKFIGMWGQSTLPSAPAEGSTGVWDAETHQIPPATG